MSTTATTAAAATAPNWAMLQAAQIRNGQTQSAQQSSQPQVPDRLRKTGQDFEGMVMGEMLTPMFAGLDTNGPFGGGTGEDAFRAFFIQELGKSMAARGGIGAGKAMINSLLSAQEEATQ